MAEKKKKWISRDDALKKLQRYCAYQDRCHQEVRAKLLDLGVYGHDLEEIITELIAENFLNEERFARSFACGKFRMKQWGRLRILRELRQRQISDYCIRKAMEELDPDAYAATLEEVIRKKEAQLRESDAFKLRSKLGQYAISRGFEPEMVWKLISEEYGA